MNAVPLSVLLHGHADVPATADIAVTGVSMDSRMVAQGELFLACRGDAGHHGLAWAEHALTRGAAAIAWEPVDGAPTPPRTVPTVPVRGLRRAAGEIASRFHGDPSNALQVVGVTGTNGKTSITHLLAHALRTVGRPCGLVGTLGVGMPDRLQRSGHTTPDAVVVQRALAAMRDAGAEAAAIEVSSHALVQHRVGGVRFRVAVFSNLTRDHLDYHEDFADYGRAKRRLFETPGLGSAVVYTDDVFGRELLRSLSPQVAAVAVGGTGGTTRPRECASRFVEIAALEHAPTGIELTLDTHAGPLAFASPLLGGFNAVNLALAAATLLELGIDVAAVAQGLASAPPVPGRMERFGGDGGRPSVIVDYAHTPDALEQVLRAARAHTRGSLWCVFGCGGDRDRGKRPLMAAVAAAWADRVVVTDDNPRTEDPDSIVEDIVEGFPAAASWTVERDRGRAIAAAVDGAGSDDVIVVAGKGHEDYQLVGNRVQPFSDRATVAGLLAEEWR